MNIAEAAVQRQLDAYNARDLQRFIAEYTDDVRVFRPPAPEPVLAGKQAFAEHCADRFNLQELHAKLVSRMVLPATVVVDQEVITGLPSGQLAAVVVYEVVEGRIRTVWFLLNPPVDDSKPQPLRATGRRTAEGRGAAAQLLGDLVLGAQLRVQPGGGTASGRAPSPSSQADTAS